MAEREVLGCEPLILEPSEDHLGATENQSGDSVIVIISGSDTRYQFKQGGTASLQILVPYSI